MSPRTITLAGQEYPVEALPFGKLRKVLPAMMRIGANLSAGNLSEADVGTLGEVAALGIGIEPAALDEMRIRFDELLAVFEAVVEVAGLSQKEPSQGEALGLSSIGTNSTPSS